MGFHKKIKPNRTSRLAGYRWHIYMSEKLYYIEKELHFWRKFSVEGRIGAEHNDWSSTPEEKVENLNLTHSLNLGSATGTPKENHSDEYFTDTDDLGVAIWNIFISVNIFRYRYFWYLSITVIKGQNL